MDYALEEMVRVFAKQPNKAFGDGGPNVVGPLPWDGMPWTGQDAKPRALTFSRFCLAVAARDYRFAVNADQEAKSFTEGGYDRGLDGVVICVGKAVVASVEEAKAIIASRPSEQVRLLFVQTKMSEYINAEDVTSFGASVQAFLTDPAFLKGVRTNEAAERLWRAYDALRNAAGKEFAPDVTLVFGYAGDWMNMGFPNVRTARRTQLANLRASFPKARFAVDIMDCDELLKASLRAGIAVTKTIKGISILGLPKRSAAAGFIGIVSAEALMAAFSRSTGGAPALDDTLFLDNPRYFRGDSERWNSGAAGLADSVKDDLQAQVVLCHNGINIVARDVRRDPADPDTLVLVTPMIVNGCQSCYTLSGLREKLAGVDLVVKIAVTRDDVLKDSIIRGSNTQEVVDDYDMLSRHPYIRELEREFDRAAPDTRLKGQVASTKGSL